MFFLIISGAFATDLHVCPAGCPYTTFQSAIDAAASNDTIFLHEGEYHEHVTISRRVTVYGDGAGRTRVDGDGAGVVVQVNGGPVGLYDLTVTGSGASADPAQASAIRIGSTSVDLSRCVISDSGFGISGADPGRSGALTHNTVITDNLHDGVASMATVLLDHATVYGNGGYGVRDGYDVTGHYSILAGNGLGGVRLAFEGYELLTDFLWYANGWRSAAPVADAHVLVQDELGAITEAPLDGQAPLLAPPDLEGVGCSYLHPRPGSAAVDYFEDLLDLDGTPLDLGATGYDEPLVDEVAHPLCPGVHAPFFYRPGGRVWLGLSVDNTSGAPAEATLQLSYRSASASLSQGPGAAVTLLPGANTLSLRTPTLPITMTEPVQVCLRAATAAWSETRCRVMMY